MKQSKLETIPSVAKPFGLGYHVITPDAKVFRLVRSKGTWVGRRLRGNACGTVTICGGGRQFNIDAERMARQVFS